MVSLQVLIKVAESCRRWILELVLELEMTFPNKASDIEFSAARDRYSNNFIVWVR